MLACSRRCQLYEVTIPSISCSTTSTRTLVDDKKIILADEPTGTLDYQSAENTICLLQKLAREKEITVVIVTHDKEIANKCDRITHIMYGKIEEFHR